MDILQLGHEYALNVLDSGWGHGRHILQFVQRTGEKYPGNLRDQCGTTSQEVLRALIDRTRYVHGQRKHWVNPLVIFAMKSVIWLFEYRAAKQHALPFGASYWWNIEKHKTCKQCGHIVCKHER